MMETGADNGIRFSLKYRQSIIHFFKMKKKMYLCKK
jgi:hypothetical protein